MGKNQSKLKEKPGKLKTLNRDVKAEVKKLNAQIELNIRTYKDRRAERHGKMKENQGSQAQPEPQVHAEPQPYEDPYPAGGFDRHGDPYASSSSPQYNRSAAQSQFSDYADYEDQDPTAFGLVCAHAMNSLENAEDVAREFLLYRSLHGQDGGKQHEMLDAFAQQKLPDVYTTSGDDPKLPPGSLSEGEVLRRQALMEPPPESPSEAEESELPLKRLSHIPEGYKGVEFVSLGMIVEDLIQYEENSVVSALGGEVLWATFGARLFKPEKQGRQIRCLVSCLVSHGSGLTRELIYALKSWNLMIAIRYVSKNTMNKAHIKIDTIGGVDQTLTYQDPPFKPMSRSLADFFLHKAAAFHLACVPRDLYKYRKLLSALRKRKGADWTPLLVWQPTLVEAPDSGDDYALAENLQKYLDALKYTDVFSLSYQELRHISKGKDCFIGLTKEQVRISVEELARIFDPWKISHWRCGGILIVRCEPYGYYYRTDDEDGWVQGYNQVSILQEDQNPMDWVGAGSAFLGAFTVALMDSEKCSLRECCRRGAVAASFAVEQFGLPRLTLTAGVLGQNPDEVEMQDYWNHCLPNDRLQTLRAAT
ncbi:hypothetical protein F4808DRAFT_454557 [Astrocystis sublimbata]|nr:hypothetical protein F4808DRAFT_454557 [Astrocystis sublimbata]